MFQIIMQHLGSGQNPKRKLTVVRQPAIKHLLDGAAPAHFPAAFSSYGTELHLVSGDLFSNKTKIIEIGQNATECTSPDDTVSS
ncbi:hypothetical protein L1987_79955 [Smallanthus sonchifolius]|uniref:Uncharacterized protein n=1 Tax=Smallanthus sonchifolius TaxID=185202 RepID=A0ACB8YM02_9ASTR|nr:hypothetical protein L1987_79955 [Smallanthus sonchifolius]